MEIDHLGRLNLAAVDALDDKGQIAQRDARRNDRPSDRQRDMRSSRRDSHWDR